MDPQEQNFVSEVMNFSEQLLNLLNKADDLTARYFANGFDQSITDESFTTPVDDTTKRGPFPHLTAAKLSAAIASIQQFQSALGDKSSGQQVNFVKMKG